MLSKLILYLHFWPGKVTEDFITYIFKEANVKQALQSEIGKNFADPKQGDYHISREATRTPTYQMSSEERKSDQALNDEGYDKTSRCVHGTLRYPITPDGSYLAFPDPFTTRQSSTV